VVEAGALKSDTGSIFEHRHRPAQCRQLDWSRSRNDLSVGVLGGRDQFAKAPAHTWYLHIAAVAMCGPGGAVCLGIWSITLLGGGLTVNQISSGALK